MIEFSKEILTHFKCDQCKKWWTVGDWVESNKMFCPHCGIVHYEFKRAEDSLGFRTAERDVLQKRVAELEGAVSGYCKLYTGMCSRVAELEKELTDLEHDFDAQAQHNIELHNKLAAVLVPLSEEEILACLASPVRLPPGWISAARAIEGALRAKLEGSE